jgi:hypothetical protein
MNIDLENCEGAVILDGLGDAIIGIVESFSGPCILYSKEKIIEILMNNGDMSEEEALEFYSFNILGLYVNEQNPVFLL